MIPRLLLLAFPHPNLIFHFPVSRITSPYLEDISGRLLYFIFLSLLLFSIRFSLFTVSHDTSTLFISGEFFSLSKQRSVYNLVLVLKENHVGDNQAKIWCADPETFSPRHYSPLSIGGICIQPSHSICRTQNHPM